MTSPDLQALERGNYISFATKKKSGDWVETPVWFAPGGSGYYVFAAGDSGKVKRLRNFSASRIASCTVSGTVTGKWLDTEAFLLDQQEDIDLALQALKRKYGWQMHTADFFSRLTGKFNKRAYIRIDLPCT
jgi:PPOX class probable F420-dependent enzyme